MVSGGARAQAVLRRVLAVPEEEVPALLEGVMRDFDARHKSLEKVFEHRFRQAAPHCAGDDSISPERRRLIGAKAPADP